MKFLIVGDWHSNVHEQPVYNALETLGNQVDCFAWHDYFGIGKNENELVWLWHKFQNKYLLGPSFVALNRALVDVVQRSRPSVLFVYRGTHITANTLREIRRSSPATLLVGYNNDDPFSPGQPRWAWRHFLSAVPEYDLMLAYRQHNLDDFLRTGARRVKLLRSWFVPEVNHPVNLTPEEQKKFKCDVVFAGHYEKDGRILFLDEIAKQGISIRIFGPDYPNKLPAKHLQHLMPIKPVRGEDYNRALCSAKIALCFMSKLNRDTYTRRCFEIPAAGTMLLSEYTNDLGSLFRQGIEADFFRSPDELISKLRLYLADEKLRKAVATAGYRRVYADGHDVVSRMRQVLGWIKEINQRNYA